MFYQLNPSIPVEIVENDFHIPTGKGIAIAVIDYSVEMHLMWVVFLDKNRECWTVPNPYIRAQYNPSLER